MKKPEGVVPARLPWQDVLAYGAPGVGAGYMYLMLGLYVMKFSTDVLLIAPAVMGIIFSVSRAWDAVSDPLVGYLSDRTRNRFGRRRTWLAACIVPVTAAFVMVFAPPQSLSDTGLVIWMALAIIGFYSSMSMFFVPHLALGAELTSNYHDRSRLFGARHALYTFGAILAVLSFSLLINAEQHGAATVRSLAFRLSLLAALLMVVMVTLAILRLRERTDTRARSDAKPLQAFTDVWKNRHARLLIVITFVEHMGFAVISVLTLYIVQYVVGAPQWAPIIILSYMIASSFSVPAWLPLARRFGKIKLWIFSLLITALSFGSLVALLFMESVHVRAVYMLIAVTVAGLAAGCGGTLLPSIQSDVIDYDEYLTGERKEGSYFATWNFVFKSAMGVTLLITGFVLQLSGFMPNQEQTMTVKIALVGLYGLFPFACYLTGAMICSRFSLNEDVHRDIRAALDQRRGLG